MEVSKLIEILDVSFYTGVPDSLLKPFCDYLMHEFGIGRRHIIAANEGSSAALAAGYHLATGKIPAVYMQNSGIGNIINPAASLLHPKVYGIPCIFIVGWRGEPGVHDEPQHIYQGEITVKLLEDMEIKTFIVDSKTTPEELRKAMEAFRPLLAIGKSVAFVVKKGALQYTEKVTYSNEYSMSREEIIGHITKISGTDPIVSTTGKASRELFENRETMQTGHQYDFLTVGSMGHASSIALGIALNKQDTKVWCVDGDGAALMHMGAMAVIGSIKPNNLVHIVINNEAHETVGGMPTAASKINLASIAEGCGYQSVICVDSPAALDEALKAAKSLQTLCFIEVKCSIGARTDLGRPTTTAKENKENFMEYLQKK